MSRVDGPQRPAASQSGQHIVGGGGGIRQIHRSAHATAGVSHRGKTRGRTPSRQITRICPPCPRVTRGNHECTAFTTLGNTLQNF